MRLGLCGCAVFITKSFVKYRSPPLFLFLFFSRFSCALHLNLYDCLCVCLFVYRCICVFDMGLNFTIDTNRIAYPFGRLAILGPKTVFWFIFRPGTLRRTFVVFFCGSRTPSLPHTLPISSPTPEGYYPNNVVIVTPTKFATTYVNRDVGISTRFGEPNLIYSVQFTELN